MNDLVYIIIGAVGLVVGLTFILLARHQNEKRLEAQFDEEMRLEKEIKSVSNRK